MYHAQTQKNANLNPVFLRRFLDIILTKCIPSWQVKCVRIPVEGLSYDVTVRLISSLTSFSFLLFACVITSIKNRT